MSGKLNTNWDVESYRHAWDSDEQWEMRKQFIHTHKSTIPEERLVCLAQVYANIQILGCKYPAAVMTEVNELAKDVPGDKLEERQKINREKKHFVKAKSSSGNFSGANVKQGCAQSQSANPDLKRGPSEVAATEPNPEPKKLRVEKCDSTQPIEDSPTPTYGYYTSGYKSQMVSAPDYCDASMVEADLQTGLENYTSKPIANLNQGATAALTQKDSLGKKSKTRALVRQLEKRVQMLERELAESTKGTVTIARDSDQRANDKLQEKGAGENKNNEQQNGAGENENTEQQNGVGENNELEIRKITWAGMLLKALFADGKNVRKHTIYALDQAQLEFNDSLTMHEESKSKIYKCFLNVEGKLFSEGKGNSKQAARLKTYKCAMNKLFEIAGNGSIVPPDMDFFSLKMNIDDSVKGVSALTEMERLQQAGKMLSVLVTNNSNIIQIVCKVLAKLDLQIDLRTTTVETLYRSTLQIGQSMFANAQAKTTEFSVLQVFRSAKKNLIRMVADDRRVEATEVQSTVPQPSPVLQPSPVSQTPQPPSPVPQTPQPPSHVPQTPQPPSHVPQTPQPPTPSETSSPEDEGDENERLLQVGRILANLKTTSSNIVKLMDRTMKKFNLNVSLRTKDVKKNCKSYLRIGSSVSVVGVAEKQNGHAATIDALRRAKKKLVRKAKLADCLQSGESVPAVKADVKEENGNPTYLLNVPSTSVEMKDLDDKNMLLQKAAKLLKQKIEKAPCNGVVQVMKETFEKLGVKYEANCKKRGNKWETQLNIEDVILTTRCGLRKKRVTMQAFHNAKIQLELKFEGEKCLSSPKYTENCSVIVPKPDLGSKIVAHQVEECHNEMQNLDHVREILKTLRTNRKTVVTKVQETLDKFQIPVTSVTKKDGEQWKCRLSMFGKMYTIGRADSKQFAKIKAFTKAKRKLVEDGGPKENAVQNDDSKDSMTVDRSNLENSVPFLTDVEPCSISKHVTNEMEESIDEIQRLLQVGKKLSTIKTNKNIVKVMRDTLKQFHFKACLKTKLSEMRCKVSLRIGQSVHTVGVSYEGNAVAAKKQAFLRAKEFLVSQAACDDCDLQPVCPDPSPILQPADCASPIPHVCNLTQTDHLDENERLLQVGRILMKLDLNNGNIFKIMSDTLKQFNIKYSEHNEFNTNFKFRLNIGQSIRTVGTAGPDAMNKAMFKAYEKAKDRLVSMAVTKDSEIHAAHCQSLVLPNTSCVITPKRTPMELPSGTTCTSRFVKAANEIEDTKMLKQNFQSSSGQIHFNSNVGANCQPSFAIFHPSQFVIIERQNRNPQQILQESVQYCHAHFEVKFEPQTPGQVRCEIYVAHRKIAEIIKPNDVPRRVLKLETEEKALEVLRTIAYTVKLKPGDETIGVEITRDALQQISMNDGCSSQEKAIEDDNVGNKLLRLMGWRGGGLGKDGQKGIEEPIKTYSTRKGRQGLGTVVKNPADGCDIMYLKRILTDYASSNDTFWIKFSMEFTKEERAQIHKLAETLDLASRSKGRCDSRFLMVGRRDVIRGLNSADILTRYCSAYEVIPPSR